MIATLQTCGVDVLFEQHGTRITDFRRGKAVGKRDHLVYWYKPKIRPEWMSREQYQAFPEDLLVRELHAGGRVLVTTLIKPREACKRELAKLYERRWNLGIDLRCIKTTLRMETLSCKKSCDSSEGVVGLLARLQPHSSADGAGGSHGRCAAARAELQTHGTDLDGLDVSDIGSFGHDSVRRSFSPHRPAASRRPTQPCRASSAPTDRKRRHRLYA